MKKQLTVALGLAVLATPALATKARLQALGEDTYGSFYINDNRNIWLNAAQINNHKDLVTYEFGSSNITTDSAVTPRAEGGVYKAYGNMVYGLHFGGGSNTANGLRQAAGATTATATPTGTANEQNNIDVFVGGDAGLKWGANLGYARNAREGSGTRGETLRTRLGVIMGDTQAYANVSINNDAKGSSPGAAGAAKFNGELGYQVGAIHAWQGNSLFVDYRQFKGESEIATTKEDLEVQQLLAGIGRVERLNDKSNLFARANLQMSKASNDRATATTGCTLATGLACKDYETTRVPVVVGLETEAASWLTLRASVGAVVWGTEESKNDEGTVDGNAIVNAGATLKFGELSVDGVIGNGGINGADPAPATQGTGTTTGTLRTDSLMSRVAMTYRF